MVTNKELLKQIAKSSNTTNHNTTGLLKEAKLSRINTERSEKRHFKIIMALIGVIGGVVGIMIKVVFS